MAFLNQGGRGYWTVNYTGVQRYSLAQQTFGSFDKLVANQ